MLERIKETAAFIQARIENFQPEVGIILGTGLGDFADRIDEKYSIDYKEIPNFPVSTVEGHKGKLIFGLLEGRRVVAMQGRFHYYEGYTMQQVTFPVRVLKLLGIRYLFVSNASGGVNPSFRVGDLMVITDHINLMPNPLIGPNMAEFGPRFPDMHNCYDQHLIIRATRIAEEKGIKLQYGVYVGGTGPTFETQAEYRYFKAIGGDAAGMSTVPEVIVARHMSIPVFGVSVITNCGLSDEVGDHEDVQRQGAKAGVKMAELFMDMIHIEKGSRYDGYFEEVARRISAALTDETREAILRLKWETPDTEKIAGIEYYMAVLRDGIRSYPDFVRWREAHPLTGVAEWMP